MKSIDELLRAVRLRANPIMVKELRSRMRGVRAFAILTGVLVLLAGVSYLFYRIVLSTTRYSNLPVGPQIGYTLLVALMLVEMLIVIVITVSLVDLAGLEDGLKVSSILGLNTTLNTAQTAGVVFDYYDGGSNFKFATINAETDELIIGHYTTKGGWVADEVQSRETDIAVANWMSRILDRICP